MAKKHIQNFIDDIPNDKLRVLPMSPTTIHSDDTFRCDMQGMTSSKPQEYNIQVQVNNRPKISSFEGMAPNTVAGPVLVPEDGSGGYTPARIKQELKTKIVKRPPLKVKKVKGKK